MGTHFVIDTSFSWLITAGRVRGQNLIQISTEANRIMYLSDRTVLSLVVGKMHY
jgi:hypothetical protein